MNKWHIASRGPVNMTKSVLQGSNGHIMLISPDEGETVAHGCHCPDDMAACMHIGKILARP